MKGRARSRNAARCRPLPLIAAVAWLTLSGCTGVISSHTSFSSSSDRVCTVTVVNSSSRRVIVNCAGFLFAPLEPGASSESRRIILTPETEGFLGFFSPSGAFSAATYSPADPLQEDRAYVLTIEAIDVTGARTVVTFALEETP